MFEWILRNAIRFRYAVVVTTLLTAILGVYFYPSLTIDAVPDITNVQVQINTEAVGYSPLEVEQRITMPIELELGGLPELSYIRSLSRYGLSQITVVFEDHVNIYFARQLLSERLQEVRNSLPPGINPSLGPIATGLGEIFMYSIENDKEAKQKRSLTELRELQDWVVKPQLRTLKGVVEINSIGGHSKQYVVTPHIEYMRAYGVSFDDIALAIANNNANVGAGYVEYNGEQILIRTPAQLTSIEDFNKIVVLMKDHTPIMLSQVASIEIGSELRTGAATANGEEVVLGTVFMLLGENGRDVSHSVTAKLPSIRASLPEGVILRPVYDRTKLVDATIETVKKNLFEGAALVIAILFLMLGNIRAALITACVIPFSMLITISGMVYGKLSANLMSLGALDFGILVDGAVILVENCMRRLEEEQKRHGRTLTTSERLQVVYEASQEVRQSTMFGEVIIMVVYIPILALSGVEGKMYHPMAMTVLLALGASMVLSLTFVPAAVAIFVKGPLKHRESSIGRAVTSFYEKVLSFCLHRQVIALSLVGIFFLFSLFVGTRLGSEFVPSLDEGDIALHAMRIPGTSLTQAVDMQHQLERKLVGIEEIETVFAKIGTAEVATDPMPPSVADGFVILKPRNEWPDSKRPKYKIVNEIEELLSQVPGNNYEFTQPIQMRFNELLAGVRSDVAVKVFGDEMEVLLEQAEEVKKILEGVEGASDVKVEQVTGLPTLSVVPDREKLARVGLSTKDVQDVLEISLAGKEVGDLFEGDRKFPIVVRLSEAERANVSQVAHLPIRIPAQDSIKREHIIGIKDDEGDSDTRAHYISVNDVSDISLTTGPNQISRENGKRRIVVSANVRGADLGTFVSKAHTALDKQLKLPPGYWTSWGGQYEHLLSAQARLTVVVPMVLILVFLMILFTFRSIMYASLIFTGVPFALTGGLLALWLRGIPLSISAAIGFIALSGVAVLNGLVLVSYIKKLIEDGLQVEQAIIKGSLTRLRPVLMTALVASLGFIPMALSQGTGSEVQRPLATVVIGGIISSTILTLLVLPIMLKITGKLKK